MEHSVRENELDHQPLSTFLVSFVPVDKRFVMYAQESPPMEALTLTPAWGGGLQERHPGGESLRQQEGGGLNISSGNSGGSGVGKGSGGGSENLGGGGGGNSGSSAVPTAYWHRQRKRRTMSSQLVFDTAVPENTEEILQADPSLGGETQ